MQLPWQKKSPSLIDAFNKIQDGVGEIYTATKDQALRIVKGAGLESSISKINNMVRENAELIFWAIAAVNIWQHGLIFAGGAVAGLTTSALGKKMGLFNESIQILKTRQNLTEYNYMSAITFFVLSPWLCSLQSGFVAGNYFGNPQPVNIQHLKWVPWIKHQISDML